MGNAHYSDAVSRLSRVAASAETTGVQTPAGTKAKCGCWPLSAPFPPVCKRVFCSPSPDQGSTYASEDYQTILDANGVVCSMSRRGNCYDNAVMESFFSTVKSELGDQFASHGDAKMELFDYIEVFYNQRRRHSTLEQISPAVYLTRWRNRSFLTSGVLIFQTQPSMK